MKYDAARELIHTGDLVCFGRAPWPALLRKYGPLRGAAGIVGQETIAAWQWALAANGDGYHGIVHVGTAVRESRHEELLLAEYTAGQTGPGLCRLRVRAERYPGPVFILRLLPEFARRVRHQQVGLWLESHRQDAYNYLGLPFAITRFLPGWPRPGALFCSEAVLRLWLWCGVISQYLTVLRGQRLAELTRLPQRYCPMRVARLGVVDSEHPIQINGD